MGNSIHLLLIQQFFTKHLLCTSFPCRRRQWHPTPVLLPGKSHGWRSLEGCSPWGCWGSDTTERFHFHFHVLEKEMATHSSVLAWRIPGTGEPDGLPSMGSHRVRHNWSDLAAAASLVAQSVKNLPAVQETRVQSVGWEDPLEKATAIHSSILAWKISWTEEPGGLQSMGSQRVGHDWATNTNTSYYARQSKESRLNCTIRRRQWQATPVFCLENPMDGGSW